MQHIAIDDLYLGVGNTITARTEGGQELSGIVSRRKVGAAAAPKAEIAVRWDGGDERSYLFVPYTAIVAINGEPVRVR
jgi:hypothetical protein